MKIKNLKLTSKVISLSLITTLSISIFTGCTTNNIYTIKDSIYTTESTYQKPSNDSINNVIVFEGDKATVLEITSIRKVDENYIELKTLDGQVLLCLLENISFVNDINSVIVNDTLDNVVKTKTR